MNAITKAKNIFWKYQVALANCWTAEFTRSFIIPPWIHPQTTAFPPPWRYVTMSRRCRPIRRAFTTRRMLSTRSLYSSLIPGLKIRMRTKRARSGVTNAINATAILTSGQTWDDINWCTAAKSHSSVNSVTGDSSSKGTWNDTCYVTPRPRGTIANHVTRGSCAWTDGRLTWRRMKKMGQRLRMEALQWLKWVMVLLSRRGVANQPKNVLDRIIYVPSATRRSWNRMNSSFTHAQMGTYASPPFPWRLRKRVRTWSLRRRSRWRNVTWGRRRWTRTTRGPTARHVPREVSWQTRTNARYVTRTTRTKTRWRHTSWNTPGRRNTNATNVRKRSSPPAIWKSTDAYTLVTNRWNVRCALRRSAIPRILTNTRNRTSKASSTRVWRRRRAASERRRRSSPDSTTPWWRRWGRRVRWYNMGPPPENSSKVNMKHYYPHWRMVVTKRRRKMVQLSRPCRRKVWIMRTEMIQWNTPYHSYNHHLIRSS